MKILTLIFLLCCMSFVSCNMIDDFVNGEKIAQIGKNKLYVEEVKRIIPKNISSEDSINFVRQYVDSWALKELMFLRALEELPKSDKDVEQLLEDYRRQLLIYKYEDKFVADRIDTIISLTERENYYDSHKQLFVVTEALIKARVLKVRKDSPNIVVIRNLTAKRTVEAMEELEQIAYNSAEKYCSYNDGWVNIINVCGDFGLNYDNIKNDIKGNNVIEYKDSLYVNFLVILEKVVQGQTSPFEYNDDKIKDIILSKRKQDLISRLHKEIYNNALDTKKLKIIEYEPNE